MKNFINRLKNEGFDTFGFGKYISIKIKALL